MPGWATADWATIVRATAPDTADWATTPTGIPGAIRTLRPTAAMGLPIAMFTRTRSRTISLTSIHRVSPAGIKPAMGLLHNRQRLATMRGGNPCRRLQTFGLAWYCPMVRPSFRSVQSAVESAFNPIYSCTPQPFSPGVPREKGARANIARGRKSWRLPLRRFDVTSSSHTTQGLVKEPSLCDLPWYGSESKPRGVPALQLDDLEPSRSRILYQTDLRRPSEDLRCFPR